MRAPIAKRPSLVRPDFFDTAVDRDVKLMLHPFRLRYAHGLWDKHIIVYYEPFVNTLVLLPSFLIYGHTTRTQSGGGI